MGTEGMPLRLAALPPGHSTHHGHLEFVVLDAAEEEEPHSIDVTAEVDKRGEQIHVRGHVQGHAQSTCHRCLATFARPLESDFVVTLQKAAEPADEDFVALDANTVEYDLAPHAREAVLLEEPIQLLCDPNCRGLCSQCGADLNQGPCGCRPQSDPRWAPLGDLRPSL